MGWFRSKRGNLTWLALFALACQLAFSFGHVHIGKVGDASGVLALADAGKAVAAVPPAGPQKNPNGVADDFCAICANIGLASTLVISDSPIVTPPSDFVRAVLRVPAAARLASHDDGLFRARGPPQA